MSQTESQNPECAICAAEGAWRCICPKSPNSPPRSKQLRRSYADVTSTRTYPAPETPTHRKTRAPQRSATPPSPTRQSPSVTGTPSPETPPTTPMPLPDETSDIDSEDDTMSATSGTTNKPPETPQNASGNDTPDGNGPSSPSGGGSAASESSMDTSWSTNPTAAFKFPATEAELAACGSMHQDEFPHGWLPGLGTNDLPDPKYLAGLADATRIDQEGVARKVIIDQPKLLKNITDAQRDSITDSPGQTIAARPYFYGSTFVQAVGKVEVAKDLKAKIAAFGFDESKVRVIPCHPRSHEMTAKNRTAPPYIIIVRLDNSPEAATLREFLCERQLFPWGLLTTYTFHPINEKRISWMVGLWTFHELFDAETEVKTFKYLLSKAFFHDDKLRGYVQASSDDKRPVDQQVFDVVRSMVVEHDYNPDQGKDSMVEVRVYLYPFESDYHVRSNIKSHLREAHRSLVSADGTIYERSPDHGANNHPLFCGACGTDEHVTHKCGNCRNIKDWKGPRYGEGFGTTIDAVLGNGAAEKAYNKVIELSEQADLVAKPVDGPSATEVEYDSEEFETPERKKKKVMSPGSRGGHRGGRGGRGAPLQGPYNRGHAADAGSGRGRARGRGRGRGRGY
ncbi:hypothetical protein V5O48_017704 [Marasmius crinis-equi]|uniref:Uncharacterized protein n=1 Tax=Marasmius crinis-equi TaxID=585013 RepID=A0ABR3EN74_9AGAR